MTSDAGGRQRPRAHTSIDGAERAAQIDGAERAAQIDGAERAAQPGPASPDGAGRAPRLGPAAPDGARRTPLPGSAAPILDQAFDGDSLPALRAAVAAQAARAGLPPHRVDDLVVAAHELAANAVRHGAGHGWLRLWQREMALECEVTDEGKPPVPGERPRPRDAARWPSERGHGVWLVRQVADETSLHSGPGGTVVTVRFSLPSG